MKSKIRHDFTCSQIIISSINVSNDSFFQSLFCKYNFSSEISLQFLVSDFFYSRFSIFDFRIPCISSLVSEGSPFYRSLSLFFCFMFSHQVCISMDGRLRLWADASLGCLVLLIGIPCPNPVRFLIITCAQNTIAKDMNLSFLSQLWFN